MPGRSISAVFAVSLSMLAAACGASETSDPAATDPAATDPAAADLAATGSPSTSPGSVASGSIDIDGSVVEYVTSVPDEFEMGATAPVLLALPPGGQDLALARRLVEGTYAPEATRLGWIVVSPAAPDGQLFFNGSEAVLPAFVDWIETWVTPEGGSPHVAGVSNGGISAFRYAALNPERVRSVITFPGFARSADDRAALADLTDVPIRMFVGEDDTSWVDASEQTVEEVRSVGGDVALTVFAGEGHIMSSTADGVLVFELLETFR